MKENVSSGEMCKTLSTKAISTWRSDGLKKVWNWLSKVPSSFWESIIQKRMTSPPYFPNTCSGNAPLTQARAPSFYFERDYGEEDGRRAFQDAEFVVTEIKKIMAMRGDRP